MSKGVWAVCAIVGLLIASPAMPQPPIDPSSDNVVTLRELVVGVGEAPLPKVGRTVANYSPEQLNAGRCMQQLSFVNQFPMVEPGMFDKAYEATLRAREARVAAFSGQATPAQVSATEIARQTAVGKLWPGRHWPYLRVNQFATQSGDLRIEALTYQTANQNTRKVVDVTFFVHNLSGKVIELPPTTLFYGDANGMVLGARTLPLPDLSIGPGSRTPYTLRLDNPPAYLTNITARFQDPGGPGAEIEFFDMHDCPEVSAAERTRAATTEPKMVVQYGGAPPVSKTWTVPYNTQDLDGLEELNLVMAEIALRPGESRPCEAPGHRQWRKLLVAAADLSRAWEAVRADEDVRQGAGQGIFLPEDVAAAGDARRAALDAAFERGKWMSTGVRYPALQFTPPKIQLNVGMTSDRHTDKADAIRAVTVTGVIRGKLNGHAPGVRVSALDADGYVVADAMAMSESSLGGGVFYSVRLPYVPIGFATRLMVEFGC